MRQFIVSNICIISIIVIFISWFLNALCDAIDHGKGAQNLNELWHLLKTASHGILFAWIMTLVFVIGSYAWWVNVIIVLSMLPLLWFTWEFTYFIARENDFHTLDDKLHMSYMDWLWK